MEVREPSAKYLAKAAYKQTEVGVIPEDWNCLMLRDCCNKVTDGTHDTPTPVRSGVPFLTAIHVKDNKIDFDACLYLSKADHEVIYSRCNPERGDVLFVNIGAGVATTALVDVDFQFSLKNVALLKPNSRAVSGHYLNYALSNTKIKIIRDLSSGGAQPFLSLTQIGAIAIPLPSTLDEQQAIAEALSDADAQIESLDHLLAKKRQIKQGAMQELLTGQKRLPGFSGEWVTRCLTELASIRSGGTPSTLRPEYWDGAVLWCTPTDITALCGHKYLSDTSRKISTAGLNASSAEVIPPKSIVMTTRATIGECAINLVPFATNQGFKNFVPLDTVDVEFLYYLLTTQKQGFISLCAGSTFLEIGKTQLAGYEVTIPPTKAEQTAIATVLSDMDAEIAALEARLAKARLLKQGMMQELLTGRIRLV
jgi:type I restriction enzyme S subunit